MDELELIINIRDLKVNCPIILIEKAESGLLPLSHVSYTDIYKRLGCYRISSIELDIMKAAGCLTPPLVWIATLNL